jgi:hypothetical protein
VEPVGAYRAKLGGSAVLGVDPGYYGLTLKEDGTYTMDWAPMESQEGLVGVSGTYVVEGDQIVLTDVEGFAACSAEEGATGTYQWSFSSEGLNLTPVQDTCEARVLVLSTKTLLPRNP